MWCRLSFEPNSNVRRIESRAFPLCSELRTIVIPLNIDIIGCECFVECHSLSSISFESNSKLARIDSKAFSGCVSLETIVIPPNVEIIGSGCFQECKSLSSILFELNSKVIRFGLRTFSLCCSLQALVIPRNVEIIEPECFSVCESLWSLSFDIDSRLVRVESEAFVHTKIHSVLLPAGVSSVADDVFPRSCVAAIANLDSDRDSKECNSVHQSLLKAVFELTATEQLELDSRREAPGLREMALND
jgi:hypothetical protein